MVKSESGNAMTLMIVTYLDADGHTTTLAARDAMRTITSHTAVCTFFQTKLADDFFNLRGKEALTRMKLCQVWASYN